MKLNQIMAKSKGEIIETYEGFEIRKQNPITISCNQYEYKRLIDAHVKTGRILSLAKILALQGGACDVCGNGEITLKPISKNILSQNKGFTGGHISSKKSNEQDT